MSVRRDGEPLRGPALALGSIAIASVVALDPAGWSPFGPAKWWAVSTIGFGAAGWALWREGPAIDRTTARVWSALLIWLSLAAVLGDDVRTALLGHPDRHLGVLTYCLFAAVFVAAQRVDDAARALALRCAVLAGLALGGYAIWELTFGRPVAVVTDTQRLLGPYGSAAFLAAAAALLVPLSMGVAADRRETHAWRVTAAVAATTGSIALLGSGTRGALVAATITSVVVLLRRRPSRRTLAIGAALVAVCLAVVAPRLGDVLERTEGTGSRLDEWRVAVRVVAAHPLVGVGPEGYRIAVAEGIDTEYERAHPRTTTLPDRAHSGPLDLALAGGVPAAAMYVALLVLVGRAALRGVGRGRGQTGTEVGLAAGVLAYGLQQLVLFPVADVDPIWWCAAGMVLATDRKQPTDRRGDAGRRVVAATSVSLGALAFVAGMLDSAADRLAKTALERSSDRDHVGAADAADRATELRPDNLRTRLVAAHVLLDDGSLAAVDAALAQLRRAADWSPDDPLVVEAMGDALLQRARITGSSTDIDAALVHWRAAVAHDPHRTTWQLELGRAAALAGDSGTARAAWLAALDLAPGNRTATDLLAALDEVEP